MKTDRFYQMLNPSFLVRIMVLSYVEWFAVSTMATALADCTSNP